MSVFSDLRRRRLLMAALAVTIGVTGIGIGAAREYSAPPQASVAAVALAGEYRFARSSGPDRTTVVDPAGMVVATFTDGARTAALTGPSRTFTEPRSTSASVTTPVWVRLLPQPWTAGVETQPWFEPWLLANLGSDEPDVLATATEYLPGAEPVTDAAGVRFAGDAGFGPPDPAGAAPSGNPDFHDYLGVPWQFPDGTEQPDPVHAGDVDGTGFVRLVYGFRHGFPLRGGDEPGPELPRRAYAMAQFAAGATVVPDNGGTADDHTALQAGDLLFFNVGAQPQLNHSAIYLGVDSDGHHRFVSSRDRADGPTLGDVGGTSVLDDGGTYSQAFRTAKRI